MYVRGNKVYYAHVDGHYFMWRDLKAEVPFEHRMTTCYNPQATITLSTSAHLDPPKAAEDPCMHTCIQNHVVCNITMEIFNVSKGCTEQPFDLDRCYTLLDGTARHW